MTMTHISFGPLSLFGPLVPLNGRNGVNGHNAEEKEGVKNHE